MHPFQETLRQKAQTLGFCGVGFTPLKSSLYEDYVRQWAEQKMYGEMTYLARSLEDRLHPQKRFPWAQSAILLAFPYGNVTRLESEPRIARYARSEDYHHLLERKLKQIQSFLQESFSHLQSQIYVDTGPLFERELAQSAGLGFIGKNTLLLHRHHGSYFLLATFLTNIPFQPDRPVDTSHCGTCRRCIDICPTQALTEYQMDARRCISYLTIEKRGELTWEEMEGNGPHYFGCDLCQEVCPFNRRPFPFSEELKETHPLAQMSWTEILNLEEDTFEQKKPKSPLRRTKRAGLLRNAIVALTNKKLFQYFADVLKHRNSTLPGVANAVDYFIRRKNEFSKEEESEQHS